MKKYLKQSLILAGLLLMCTGCGQQAEDDPVRAENGSGQEVQMESVAVEDTQGEANAEPQEEVKVSIEGTVVHNSQTTKPEDKVLEEISTVTGAVEMGNFVLSQGSGFYEEAFDLTIESDYENVFYTMDGSDPATSETAVKYEDCVTITDRRGEANVVAAVDPILFAGSYNQVEGNGFTTYLEAPEDEAVDKCTYLRIVAVDDAGEAVEETSAVYYIGSIEEHIQGIRESCEAAGMSLAVMNIAVDYDDLYDHETGIYVKGKKFEIAKTIYQLQGEKIKDGETARSLDANYKQKGREWEKEARISMLECTAGGAREVLNQNCGIRIQGNYSRSDVQKGFRLYAREDYGDKRFRYAVFGEDYVNDEGEVMDSYKTLVLRGGGNCAFLSKFNDTYWQSLLDATACDTQHSRPCVVYVNGEYFGLYVLQEDYTGEYFEDVHGVNSDDVVLYKGDAESLELGYKLDEGDLPEGENDESYYYRELLEFFDTHEDLKNEADFVAFAELVDVESLMDYFAIQSWINNKWDWPGKNWSMWKTIGDTEEGTYGDGKWRFVFYDMEFGGVSGSGDARTNTIKEDNYQRYGLLDKNTSNPAVLSFAYAMTNETFREAFKERLTGLSEAEFEQSAALERLTYFEDVYGPLFEQFFVRYPGTGDAKGALEGGYGTAACIRGFLLLRQDNISKLTDYIDSVPLYE
ncbi:MAG: CotH kinase family protein [Lachnospiraceae bacterium]|nr:CotH kinase family protein [Lachnospiraceae bacterium]